MSNSSYFIAPENSGNFVHEAKFSLLFGNQTLCLSWPVAEECQKVKEFLRMPESMFHLLVGGFLASKISEQTSPKGSEMLVEIGNLLFSKTVDEKNEILKYFDFTISNRDLFDDLQGCDDHFKFLTRSFLGLFTRGSSGSQIASECLNLLTDSLKDDFQKNDELKSLSGDLLLQYDALPPSLCHLFGHLMDLCVSLDKEDRIVEAASKSIHSFDDLTKIVSLVVYLLIISINTQSYNSVILTSDVTLAQHLRTLEKLIMKDNGNHGEPWRRHREAVSAYLGSSVISTLPNFALLPIDEILQLKNKHNEEIISFQNGMARISKVIDFEMDSDAVENAIQEVLYSEIQPSVQELRSSIDSLGKEKVAGWVDQGIEFGLTMGATFAFTQDMLMTSTVGVAQAMGKILNAFRQNQRTEQSFQSSPFSLILRLEKLGN